jgi:MoaA/NifB/PqqE/SkfB family radical SAM enzyme
VDIGEQRAEIEPSPAPENKKIDLPPPVPSAGIEAYRRERQLCLAGDPRKKKNYDRYLANGRGNANVDNLPIKLDIENVSRCNFRCTMCVVSDWPKGQRGPDMGFDDFKKLIDEQYGLVEVKIQGIGEPSMQGDIFFNMVAYARARNIWVRSSTNGSLLHLNDNYKKYVDCGINELQISLDGATPEVFESIRRGADFTRIIKNCELINRYSREQNLRVTKVWTLVQNRNAHQLVDLIDLAANLGFQDLVFSFNVGSWGLDRWRAANGEIGTEAHYDRDLVEKLMDRADERGIRLGFWEMEKKYRRGSKDTLCPWPFERAMVTSDMRTVPCCTISNPDAFEMEPGSGKSFKEIWLGEAYRNFRQAHLDGEIPEICAWCYDG